MQQSFSGQYLFESVEFVFVGLGNLHLQVEVQLQNLVFELFAAERTFLFVSESLF